MSQLTIKLSDRADALIAQLQKEIFNRRRKKVSPAGVVQTLVESGAKSQSDKRFATSWKNLIADIEKAAKLAQAHGAKPTNLSDEEWAMVLSHRTRLETKPSSQSAEAPKARKNSAARKAAASAKPATARKAAAKSPTAGKPSGKKAVASKAAVRNPVRKKAPRATTLKLASSGTAASPSPVGAS